MDAAQWAGRWLTFHCRPAALGSRTPVSRRTGRRAAPPALLGQVCVHVRDLIFGHTRGCPQSVERYQRIRHREFAPSSIVAAAAHRSLNFVTRNNKERRNNSVWVYVGLVIEIVALDLSDVAATATAGDDVQVEIAGGRVNPLPTDWQVILIERMATGVPPRNY